MLGTLLLFIKMVKLKDNPPVEFTTEKSILDDTIKILQDTLFMNVPGTDIVIERNDDRGFIYLSPSTIKKLKQQIVKYKMRT